MAYPALQDGPTFTLIAAATMAGGARVKIDSNGQAALAGLTENAVGFLTERGSVSGDPCTIRAAMVPAMQYGKAHSSIVVGALLYSQASGRVDDADGGSAKVIGYALTAAGAQDDVIVIVRAN